MATGEGCGRIGGWLTPPKKAVKKKAVKKKAAAKEKCKKACGECSSPYCECDGTCDEDYATSCHRCDTWVCGYCVVEGACHDCFSKMQGGVN